MEVHRLIYQGQVIGVIRIWTVDQFRAIPEDVRINLHFLSHVVDLNVSFHPLDFFNRFAPHVVGCAVFALINCQRDDIEFFGLPIGSEVNFITVADARAALFVVPRTILQVLRANYWLDVWIPVKLLGLIDPVSVELDVVIVNQVDDLASEGVLGPQPLVEGVIELAHVDSCSDELFLVLVR